MVINLARGLYNGALALDAATGHVLWSRQNFTAGAVSGDTVIGVEPQAAPATTEHVVGLALADGRQRWAQVPGYGLTVDPAGPHLVAAAGLLPGYHGSSTFQLLHADTGAVAANLPIDGTLPSRCVYDQVSSVVCTAPTDDRGGARVAVGVNAMTGRQLWSMPNDNTGTLPVPVFTSACRGILYAQDQNVSPATLKGPPVCH